MLIIYLAYRYTWTIWLRNCKNYNLFLESVEILIDHCTTKPLIILPVPIKCTFQVRYENHNEQHYLNVQFIISDKKKKQESIPRVHSYNEFTKIISQHSIIILINHCHMAAFSLVEWCLRVCKCAERIYNMKIW